MEGGTFLSQLTYGELLALCQCINGIWFYMNWLAWMYEMDEIKDWNGEI